MNKYRYLRAGAAVIIGILSVSAFAGLFYPLKIFDFQLTALLQRVLVDFSLFAVILAAALVLFTFLFGRIYCSILCPLGLYQEFLMLLFRRRTGFRPNRPYKYFLAALVFGALIGGTAVLVRLIDPYTLFGSAAGGAWLGLSISALLAVLVWFRGRLFCSNICPVGAVLGIISKHAVNKIYIEKSQCVSCGLCASHCPTGSIDIKNKTVDNETCIKCFNCLSRCPKNSLHYGTAPIPAAPFSPTRRKLLTGGAVAAIFVLALKSGIDLGKAVAAKVKKPFCLQAPEMRKTSPTAA